MPAESLPKAALSGAFLGLVVYGVYDLTNLAILAGWTLRVALADLAWGSVASSTAASVGCLAARLAGAAG